MTSKAKSKGNSLERAVCEIMKETFGGSWLRVPSSGAFTGGKNAWRKEAISAKQTGAMTGDIIPDDSMQGLSIECKNYADFSWSGVLLGKNKQIDGWIEQAAEAAKSDHNLWLLIMKFNNQGIWTVYDKNKFSDFQLVNYMVYKDYIIVNFKEFLSLNKQKIIELSQ